MDHETLKKSHDAPGHKDLGGKHGGDICILKKGYLKSYAVPVEFTVEFNAAVPAGVLVGLTV